jgi:hypothetical protein
MTTSTDGRTPRSGFTHVRRCNDCKEEIGEGDRCGCPPGTPFVKGAAVTVCLAPEGKLPIALHTIGRIGNGAFRLVGTDSWYKFDGTSACATSSLSVRLTLPTDEADIAVRVAEGKRRKEHDRLRSVAADYRNQATAERAMARRVMDDAAERERHAKGLLARVAEIRASAERNEEKARQLDALATDSENKANALAKAPAADPISGP